MEVLLGVGSVDGPFATRASRRLTCAEFGANRVPFRAVLRRLRGFIGETQFLRRWLVVPQGLRVRQGVQDEFPLVYGVSAGVQRASDGDGKPLTSPSGLPQQRNLCRHPSTHRAGPRGISSCIRDTKHERFEGIESPNPFPGFVPSKFKSARFLRQPANGFH